MTPGPETPPHFKRFGVLGVQVCAVDMRLALGTMEHWIRHGTPNYVCVTGVHGVMESQRSADLMAIHNSAGLVTPDGMPLVWIGKARGHRHMERVYGPDLMLAASELSLSHGWKHFYYGGKPGVADLLGQRLCTRFPGLQIAGTFSPPFRPLTGEEDQRVVQAINDSGADIVWVGLSTPKQERWMAAHVGRLRSAALVGVGAAFDFLSGTKVQSPRIIQRSGFEWLFRMLSEPRRLSKRYLANNTRFLCLLALESLGMRRPGDD